MSERRAITDRDGLTPVAYFERVTTHEAGGGKERATCTVKALAITLSIPFLDAHRKLELLGRGKGRGFRFDRAAKYYRFETLPFEDGTVKEALALCQQGRYVIKVRGHVFAVVDGVVYDHTAPKLRAKALAIYKYKTHGNETNQAGHTANNAVGARPTNHPDSSSCRSAERDLHRSPAVRQTDGLRSGPVGRIQDSGALVWAEARSRQESCPQESGAVAPGAEGLRPQSTNPHST